MIVFVSVFGEFALRYGLGYLVCGVFALWAMFPYHANNLMSLRTLAHECESMIL